MITSKLNKIILILFVFSLAQCYTEPFFELTVEIKDQNSNPISDLMVKIEITDLDDGSLIEESIIGDYFEDTTDENGRVSFSFDNKALITARVCYINEATGILSCAQGHSYLEENT